jgi:hypothetical protein
LVKKVQNILRYRILFPEGSQIIERFDFQHPKKNASPKFGEK